MADHKLEIILAARDATKKTFQSVTGRVKALTGNVFSLRGAFATLAGTGGIGLFIKKSLDTADTVGKTADKLGVSTDALQEYRHAARIAGIQQNTLDMALQRFTRRTAEAAQGKGELKGVLEQYNVAVRDAAGNTRDHEDVLNDLADVIAGTESESERLRIAFKAFDSEGAALVNMLKKGSAGLEKTRRDARDLGIVMDEQLIRNSEKAKDELEKLTRVITVQLSSAAVGLAPEIARIAENTTDWWKANQELVKTDVAAYAEKIKTSLMNIHGFYSALPPEIIGAASYGIVGRLLFGGWGPAKIISSIYLINEGLKQFHQADIGSVVRNWKEWETSINNIMDVIAGNRDWMTGAQIPQKQPIPQTPATFTGEIGPGTKGWEIYQPPKPPPPPAMDTGAADAAKKTHDSLMKEVAKAQAEFQRSLVIPGGTAELMESQLRVDVGQYITGFDGTREDMEKTREAFEAMYSDLKFQSGDYYEYRKAQLTAQAEDYEKYTGDTVLAHQWLTEQIKALDQERLEASKQNNVWMVELSERTSDAMEDNFSKFYRDFFRGELDSAADYFRAFCNSLSDSFSDMLGQMTKEMLFGGGSSGGKGFFGSLFSGIGGLFTGGTSLDDSAGLGADWAGTLFHKGGTVGKDAAPLRHVPAALFAHAPRLHKGLAPDEFPAILQRGETVIPRNQSPSMTRNTSISVPVAVESVEDRRLSARLQTEVERTVIRIMREEMR